MVSNFIGLADGGLKVVSSRFVRQDTQHSSAVKRYRQIPCTGFRNVHQLCYFWTCGRGSHSLLFWLSLPNSQQSLATPPPWWWWTMHKIFPTQVPKLSQDPNSLPTPKIPITECGNNKKLHNPIEYNASLHPKRMVIKNLPIEAEKPG